MDENIIQKIKERADTFEVIQRFSDVHLKKDGRHYKGNCPFHNEKTASFVVTPSKNLYKCFGCGASGDAVSFVMQNNGLSYIEALKSLANYYNVALPHNDSTFELKVIHQKVITEKKLTPDEIRLLEEEQKNKVSAQIYHLKKTAKTEAENYIKSRSIDPKKLPSNSFYQSNPYKSKDGMQFPAGISFLDSTENFINKRFIGDLPKGVGKSRNAGTMTNKIYAKTIISGQNTIYVTEGVINAMSIFQCEKSALATFATSNEFTDATNIINYFKNKKVVLAFDNDQAGQAYIVKFAKFLYDNEKTIQFSNMHMVMWPDSRDANDYLAADELSAVLADKANYISLTKDLVYKQYQQYQQAKKDMVKDYVPKFEQTELKFFADSKKEIQHEDCVYIGTNYSYPVRSNYVAFNDKYPEKLYNLEKLTNNIVLAKPIKWGVHKNEQQIVKVCKMLVAHGFNLKVLVESADFEETGDPQEEISFIQYYTDQLVKGVLPNDSISKTEAVKKAAAFLATLDSSIYTVEYTGVYKKFGLNKADWNTIAKQYISNEKHKQIYSLSADDNLPNVGELTDPHNLPHYVDVNDFYRKGYFAAQNKEGKEVLYMFRSKEDGLFVASNFAFKMIGHLYNNERAKNKRIIKLTDEYGRDYYMEIESSVIRSFNDFSNRIYEESNLFFLGSKRQFEILLKHVSNNIPKWIELEILGQSKADFFSFADGIYDYRKQKFLPIDDLGIVSYDGTTYYIPTFSSIYNKINGYNDRFDSAKFLRYHKSKKHGADFDHTSFHKWTELMADVFKEDNSGMFAVIFVIMSAFRDFIYNQHRRFPLFFLSGPTNSGKSQVADSIQAPFAQGMQIYNLNSGTDAAFFVSLEKYRNVPMIFDEYNDMQISKIKFQGLKAGYDGVGKQKKKDVTSKDLDMSEVNCSIVYLGQEIPEQDDYALFNRSLSFFIPLKDYSPEETLEYDNLKKREELGLTNILTEILNTRDLLEKYYYRTQIVVKDEMKKELQAEGSKFVERILNSLSEYLAVFKIMLDHSNLDFAFDYASFYQAAKDKCIRLSEMVQTANRLAVFFQTITYLFNTGKLVSGREFKIETRTDVIVRKSQNETKDLHFDQDRKVIFLRINLIFPLYRDIQRNESLKTSLLSTYLKDSPSWIGSAVNEDFEWYERKIINKDNQVGDKYVTEEYVSSKIRNTTAIALDYDLLDLDLEKISTSNQDASANNENTETAEEGIPF